ncbi:hypothetical protein GCM10027589_50350 [Actinocorallia lasiicapitis]
MGEEGKSDGSRRELLVGIGLIGVAATACGGEDPPALTAPEEPAGPAKKKQAGGGRVLGKAADVPVGGGVVFGGQKIVVTQPTKGEFVAFSAVCTHQGCTVAEVEDGTINCPCHGSKFAVADGSVVNGPAAKALPARKIKLVGGEITIPT